MTAIVAGRAIVVRHREHRLAHWNQRNTHLLRSPRQNALTATHGNGRQIVIAGGDNLQMVVPPRNADNPFDAIVIGRQFLVAQRPIFFNSRQRPLPKILRCIAQSDGIPMQCPPTENPDAVHSDRVRVFVANRRNVLRVKEGLLLAPKPAIRQLIRPPMGKKARRGNFLARFEHDYLGAAFGKLFRDHSSGCARPNHTHVVNGHNSYSASCRPVASTPRYSETSKLFLPASQHASMIIFSFQSRHAHEMIVPPPQCPGIYREPLETLKRIMRTFPLEWNCRSIEDNRKPLRRWAGQ